MLRFIKNVLYGLLHFGSFSGRDSRQTYCDIYRGFIVLALAGICFCMWRNTLAVMYVREWLVISEKACWVVTILFELWLLMGFCAAVVRRWQDLDINIPQGDSFSELIKRPRFYEVLANEEGSRERNKHGDAPDDNPTPVICEDDFKKLLSNQLFVDTDTDSEQIK